jgi:hypothetical protein
MPYGYPLPFTMSYTISHQHSTKEPKPKPIVLRHIPSHAPNDEPFTKYDDDRFIELYLERFDNVQVEVVHPAPVMDLCKILLLENSNIFVTRLNPFPISKYKQKVSYFSKNVYL